MEPTPEPKLAEVLQRLSALHPKKIDLSLGRMIRLLGTLGNPEKNLPPVIHVAGTNGKGSVIAYLRAILEAGGSKVHVYTSPHLVSFRERFRLAGSLIGEDRLIDLLGRVESANKDQPVTFFEITTAAALVVFTEVPADVVLLEVGLGGRLDATNVIRRPMASVITPVGLDHAAFLGDKLAGVAKEKAGIIKKNTPVVIGPQDPAALKVILARAGRVGARAFCAGRDWSAEKTGEGFRFRGLDREFALPHPILSGPHQIDNAATAVAALLARKNFRVSEKQIKEGLNTASWPARFQPLDPKKLGLSGQARIWLDGGHNPLAGKALADVLKTKNLKTLVVIIGMMEGKDVRGFLAPLAPFIRTLIAVPIPGQANAQSPETIAETASRLGIEARAGKSFKSALATLPRAPAPDILITGSLYLAGSVLSGMGETPK